MDKRQLLTELETVVASGFPDVLSVSGRCNAPLLVDWLVDTVFALEDAQPPEVKGDKASAGAPLQPLRLQSCFSTDLHSIEEVLAESQKAAAAPAVDVQSKESLQQAVASTEQLKHTLFVVEATTFPCAAELGWLQQTVKQQQRRQQHGTLKQEAAGTAVKQEAMQQLAGSSSQAQPGGSSTAAVAPQWVRCSTCKRTVLPLKLAAHQANCARRRALAEKQAAALATKAASQGRPATPPLSTTSGRSGAGTAAAAAAGRAGSAGGYRNKRSASYLNPNRARSPAATTPATGAVGAAAAAAGVGLGAGALGSPAGAAAGLFVAHPGASMHPGGRHKPPAAAGIGPGPLGPGLMVYGAGRGAGQGAAAAAADMGKPPLPKPSMRAAAAAAAAVDYGGSAQQQAGVHALINPGAIHPGAAGLNPGAALPAGFVPHGRSPSPSQGLPAPALTPDVLAQFAGAAGDAGQGFGVLGPGLAVAAAAAGGSIGFAAVGQVGGLCGMPEHPAAVPHTRRPRSVQPPRRKRARLDAIAAHWDQLVTGALAAATANAAAHGQKRPSNGLSAPCSKHHAAAGADGYPVRPVTSGGGHGSKHSSKQSGGKPAASKLKLRGQGGAVAKRSDAAAAAAGGSVPGSGSRGSAGGAVTSDMLQQQHSVNQRPRRNSSKGGKEPSEPTQHLQHLQLQQQQHATPLTRQQHKQQKEAESALLFDADIGDLPDLADIPDDILDLANDPIFGSGATLNTVAAGAAEQNQQQQQQQVGVLGVSGGQQLQGMHPRHQQQVGPGGYIQQQQQVPGMAMTNGWMQQHQQQQHQHQQMRQHQSGMPPGFVPTAGMAVAAATSGGNNTWQPEQQQQPVVNSSTGVLQANGRTGSLSEWLPSMQQQQQRRQQHQQVGLMPMQHVQPMQQQQQQQQARQSYQQQVQQMQMMHMQQMQAMQQQKQQHQLAAQPPPSQQQQQQKAAVLNGMMPTPQTSMALPSGGGGMMPTPQTSMAFSSGAQVQQQQQQQQMVMQQQMAMAAWQQQQAATMQRMGSGGPIPNPMMPPGFPMGFAAFPPGMLTPAGMMATPAFAAASAAQQQQQQQQQMVAAGGQAVGQVHAPGAAAMRPQLINSITQGAAAFLDPAASAVALQMQQGAGNMGRTGSGPGPDMGQGQVPGPGMMAGWPSGPGSAAAGRGVGGAQPVGLIPTPGSMAGPVGPAMFAVGYPMMQQRMMAAASTGQGGS